MLLTAYSAPPEKAKIPPMGKTISRSVLRTDRTGPTTVGIRELKIAAKRVMPPSTISSYTTSASCTPLWGNAWGVLSILIVRAERCFVTFDGSGRPVSGATGPGFFCAGRRRCDTRRGGRRGRRGRECARRQYEIRTRTNDQHHEE